MTNFDKIKNLQDLLTKGLISEDEFKSLKNEILNTPASPKENQFSDETIRRFVHYGKILKETQNHVWVLNHRSGKTFKFDKNNPKHGIKKVLKENESARFGLMYSLIGLLVNPFIILGVIGIVFSSIGLSKDRKEYSGHGKASAGLIIGIIDTIFGIIVLIYYFNQ